MWNSYTSTVSHHCIAFPLSSTFYFTCGDCGHFSLSFIKLCLFVVIEEYPTLFKRKTPLFYCAEIRECISTLRMLHVLFDKFLAMQSKTSFTR